jgi:hypothetical protein
MIKILFVMILTAIALAYTAWVESSTSMGMIAFLLFMVAAHIAWFDVGAIEKSDLDRKVPDDEVDRS